jgi:hypothetical protein
MLQPDPSKRATLAAILKHPWMTGVSSSTTQAPAGSPSSPLLPVQSEAAHAPLILSDTQLKHELTRRHRMIQAAQQPPLTVAVTSPTAASAGPAPMSGVTPTNATAPPVTPFGVGTGALGVNSGLGMEHKTAGSGGGGATAGAQNGPGATTGKGETPPLPYDDGTLVLGSKCCLSFLCGVNSSTVVTDHCSRVGSARSGYSAACLVPHFT